MPPLKPLVATALGPLLYLFGCAVLAAAAAYPLFRLFGGDDAAFLRTLVSRGGQVFLLLGLYPLAKALGMTAGEVGWHRGFPRQLARGFLLGTLMLSLHILALLALNLRAINAGGFPEPGRLLAVLGKALAIGIIVALLEETIFRGVLFGVARKFTGPLLAVALSALYFAGLHFIRVGWTPELAEIGWDTGFRIAADGFAHVGNLQPDSFLALLLAGTLLGCIRAAIPGSLGLCMGVHAGWVFVIKAAKPLTHINLDAEWWFLVSRYDRIIGLLSSAWMTVIIVVFLAALRPWGGDGRSLARNR